MNIVGGPETCRCALYIAKTTNLLRLRVKVKLDSSYSHFELETLNVEVSNYINDVIFFYFPFTDACLFYLLNYAYSLYLVYMEYLYRFQDPAQENTCSVIE